MSFIEAFVLDVSETGLAEAEAALEAWNTAGRDNESPLATACVDALVRNSPNGFTFELAEKFVAVNFELAAAKSSFLTGEAWLNLSRYVTTAGSRIAEELRRTVDVVTPESIQQFIEALKRMYQMPNLFDIFDFFFFSANDSENSKAAVKALIASKLLHTRPMLAQQVLHNAPHLIECLTEVKDLLKYLSVFYRGMIVVPNIQLGIYTIAGAEELLKEEHIAQEVFGEKVRAVRSRNIPYMNRLTERLFGAEVAELPQSYIHKLAVEAGVLKS